MVDERYEVVVASTATQHNATQINPTMSSDSDGRRNKNDSLALLLKSMGGDDCDRPACDDTKSALSAALKRVGKSASSDIGGAPSKTTAEQQSSSSSEKKNHLPNSYSACPPTKDVIGSSTWTLVHTMVSYPTVLTW